MNIYLISRYKGADYEEFSAHVVHAATADKARKLCEDMGRPSRCWMDDEKAECQHWGRSVIGIPKEEIILSDFRHG